MPTGKTNPLTQKRQSNLKLPNPRKQLGSKGEDEAKEFLLKKGWFFIEANFRIRGGEIDLIFIDGLTLVFVEVKTRNSPNAGYPEESVTPSKLRKIQRTAQMYLLKHPEYENRLCRIDVIAIDTHIRHHEAVNKM